MSILDEFGYPWSDPLARELHATLTLLNPAAAAALSVAAAAGLDTSLVNPAQAPYFVWVEILDQAAANGMTRAVVTAARDRLPRSSGRRPFLDELLAGHRPPIESEPRGADGAPAFLRDDDTVSEPEALLFRDDLTIQMGRVPALIATLQRLVGLAPAVCRMVVDVNGQEMSGSGFRIGPDTLLTNHHVLHLPADSGGTRATRVTAEFGYEDDGAGGVLPTVSVPCDVATIRASKEDDWAVIKVRQPLEDRWPILRLGDAAEPVLNSPAYIVQHPLGQRKRLGFVRNQVSAFDDRVVHYLTDTQEGSSGSPVLDGNGQLIALHHAGGRPQDVAGRPPVKKNEGIRIPTIVAGLADHP
jgi:S1-C subfamily serine protease